MKLYPGYAGKKETMRLQDKNGKLYILLVVTLELYCFSMVTSWEMEIDGYYQWTPSHSSRTDLYCPNKCEIGDHRVEKCCSCNTKLCIEILSPAECNVTVAELHVEYLTIFGDTTLFVRPNETDSNIFTLVHPNRRMQKLPDNLCEFPNIQTLDLKYNRIGYIANITCLADLNYLDLSFNNITSINNSTFWGLENLRELYLTGNDIETLEPNTLKIIPGGLLYVHVDQNPIDNIDITNVLSPGAFCVRNFSSLPAKSFTNNNTYMLTDDSQYVGPGKLSFDNGNFETFFNVTEVGVSPKDATKYMDVDYGYEGASIFCDCSIVPILKSFGHPSAIRFWPNFFNFTCSKPDHMAGVLLTDYIKENSMDALTCPVVENCPYKCSCNDNQNIGRVIVDCTNAGLTSLPSDLPVGSWNNREIDLILDGCNIQNFENRNYMDRVSSIQMSGNPVTRLDANALASLPDDFNLDLSSMQLSDLPASLRTRDPSKITFGSNPITCTCENQWIGDWLRSYGDTNRLQCYVNGKIKFVETVNRADLDCPIEIDFKLIMILVVLSIVLILSAIFALLAYCFRYELIVLFRWKFKSFKREHTIYIMFDDDDESQYIGPDKVSVTIVNWIRRELKPRLEKEGYTTFVEFLDVYPGDNIENTITKAIAKSKTYIIVYTKHFCTNEKTYQQFKHAWNKYKGSFKRDIILINFDYTCIEQVSHKKVRALYRFARPIDFTETSEPLLGRLVRRLGTPNVAANEDEESIEENFTDDDSEEGSEWTPDKPRFKPQNTEPSHIYASYVDKESMPANRYKLDKSVVKLPLNESFLNAASTSADDDKPHRYAQKSLFRHPGPYGKGFQVKSYI